MKVKELITLLQTLDQEKEVVCIDGAEGWSRVEGVKEDFSWEDFDNVAYVSTEKSNISKIPLLNVYKIVWYKED